MDAETEVQGDEVPPEAFHSQQAEASGSQPILAKH